MNITGTSASAAAAQQSSNILMVKKAQDLQKSEGLASVSLIESAGQVQGRTLAKAASPAGIGGHVDLHA